jgi:hypothetical protein
MAAPTTPNSGNGDLPAPDSWADEFPRIDAPLDMPIRAAQAGVGDEFIMKLVPRGTPGAKNKFFAIDGSVVNFASTELNAWGSLIGDIQDQADLWTELQARPLTADLSQLAFTGDWVDISGKPPFGNVSLINTNGTTNQFLRGDGSWAIPQDVFAQWGSISGDINAQNDLIALLNLKAPLANPTFTGLVQAPTRPVDDSSTGVATTAWFFGQAFDGVPVMAGAASSGDSKRWARGNHRHPTDTTRAPLDSPAFTGFPTAPTPPPGDNSDVIATTAFVKAVASLPDAPVDGGYYVRRNGAWVAIDLGTKWDNDGTP